MIWTRLASNACDCPRHRRDFLIGIFLFEKFDRRFVKFKLCLMFQGMKGLAGARYEAKVGVLKDYDNIWDARLDK